MNWRMWLAGFLVASALDMLSEVFFTNTSNETLKMTVVILQSVWATILMTSEYHRVREEP